MIKIRNLSQSYRERVILDSINLDIAPGEIHGILGPSGAGKSTFLRCINGIEQFSNASSIQVDNTEINNLSPSQLRIFRKNMGMIFQEFALLERKTALENVMLPMSCWYKNRREIVQRADDLLQCVGMADKACCRPAELSGGQKQRVAIARALALHPKILLCDEATSALDPLTAKSILDLLKKINKDSGITIVMVTHQMDVAKYACDRLSIIENGRIMQTNTVDHFFLHQPELLPGITDYAHVEIEANEIGFHITLADIEKSMAVLFLLSRVANDNLRMLFTSTDDCKAGKIVHYSLAVSRDAYPKVEGFLNQNNIQFQKLTA